MIEAQLADGTVLEFPDGTADAVIDKVVAGHVSPSVTNLPPDASLSDVLSSPEAVNADVPGGQPSPGPVPSTGEAWRPAIDTVGRIGSAVVEGAQAPAFLTPAAKAEAEAQNQQTWVGRNIVSPLVSLSELPFRGMNALGAGLAQTAVEGGAAVGAPALGRDVNMLMQVAPFAGMGAGVPRVPGPAPEAAPGPRFVQEHYGEGVRGNPLAAEPQAPAPSFVPPEAVRPPAVPLREPTPAAAPRPDVFVPPTDQIVPPGELGSIPPPRGAPPAEPANVNLPGETRSAGAAASREGTPPGLVDMTPAEVQAYRSTAEGQKLLERQEPGVPDRNVYIEGVNPNLAEQEQSVAVARELKEKGIKSTEVSQEAKEVANRHNDQRVLHLENTIKSPVDVNNARAARKAQLDRDYPAAFVNAKPIDSAPVVDAIQVTLRDPRGMENTQLKTYVAPLLRRLVNEDGTLKITDPERLYGFREDLRRMRSKASKVNDPNLEHVSQEIGDIIDVTDKAIEAAAPGYRKYMDNYAEWSRKIDEMTVLQGHEKKLYDAQNRLAYAKVQTMMRQILDSRAAEGLNPYKSITDETMARLWALRDDLRRTASAKELASAPGSDTAQNAWDIAKGLGGQAAAHGLANLVLPGWGSGVVMGLKHIADPIFGAHRLRKDTARGMEILHPGPTIDAASIPRNKLAPP